MIPSSDMAGFATYILADYNKLISDRRTKFKIETKIAAIGEQIENKHMSLVLQ